MYGKSLDIANNKINKLKKIMPEVFTEGKIDFDKLKLVLGEDISIQDERYVLNWAGKTEAFKVLQQPTMATLTPDKEKSINFDNTKHIFIEGENLEVLKILQKSYKNKIKMIYIDPPYNTGNDTFIYPDRFQESKEEYLKRVEDKDENGYLLKEGYFKKNNKENGHYHSNWLSMIYPRLYLARNLLRDDGVIFVSIDDNEVHNLKCLMNEVFGEENFISNIIWHSKYTTSNDSKTISKQHEHILLYSKNSTYANLGLLPRTEKMNKAYTNPDKDPRGPWKATPLHAKSGNSNYIYKFKNGIEWTAPIGRYPRYSKSTLKKMDEENRIWFGVNLETTPSTKSFLSEVKQGKTVGSLWSYSGVGHTHKANEELAKILGKGVFDNPKPIDLIKNCIRTGGSHNDIILDFFSGSSTTAHAVLDLNKEENTNTKFIIVQLPEKTDEKSEAYKQGYKTISDIGKERIKRVIDKLKKKNEEQLPMENDEKQDLGFRFYKLTPSNFKIWRGDIIENGEDLQLMLEGFKDPLKRNITDYSMVWELAIKSGYDLATKIEKIVIDNIDFYSISNGELYIGVSKISDKSLQEIISKEPKSIILLDKLFNGNDQLKTNTALQMKDADIKFNTI